MFYKATKRFKALGPAVAALGAVAGGMLGKAIMGDPAPIGPDKSIPGITSATVRKGTKGAPAETVTQVDASPALGWLRQAAVEQTSSYMQGLNYYTDSLKMAAGEIKKGFTAANNTLAPLSISSTRALNEQMRMMGLDPVPTSYASQQAMKGINADIAMKMEQANKIQDPGQRAQAKQDILGSINQLKSDIATKQAFSEASPSVYKADNYASSNNIKLGPMANTDAAKAKFNQFANANINSKDPTSHYGIIDKYNASEQAKVAESQSAYDSWAARKDANEAAIQLQQNELEGIAGEFGSNYAEQYDGAYTGDQITAKLEATPGYKFQMEQGTKAIERQGAAKGMLGSGNTLTALAQYGQGLAQNFYGMYMDNLSNIVAEGSGATMAIANNKQAEGQIYGNLMQQGGDAYLRTYGAIGDAKANSLYNQAATFTDVAKFNAQMQQNAIDGLKGKEHATMMQGMSMAPAMQANALNQTKLNYDIFNNQQAGQQFYAPQSSNRNYTGASL